MTTTLVGNVNGISTSVAATPAHVGDLAVITLRGTCGTAPMASGVSGGGVTTWTLAAAYTSSQYEAIEVWYGIVTKAGASTATVTLNSGSSLSTTTWAEFATTLGPGAWSVDKHAAGACDQQEAVTTSPGITPAASGELGIALAQLSSASMTPTASPSTGWGFQTLPNPPWGYNLSVPVSSTTVTATAAYPGVGVALVVFFSFVPFTAPAVPTLVGPLNGSTQSAGVAVTLEAQYNSTDGQVQSAFAVRLSATPIGTAYWDVATQSLSATIVWNPDGVTAPGGTFSVTIPASVFSAGYNYSWSMASAEAGAGLESGFASTFSFLFTVTITAGLMSSWSGAVGFLKVTDPVTAGLQANWSSGFSLVAGFPPPDVVPWVLPVAINDHPYMVDFSKTRITTMQVRRVSADDSVEPGEQTLSAAGVWPRAQDNWFLGSGQEFLDNRFAFESVYVHSGEYPSVRTRFWESLGIDCWTEGQLTLLDDYAQVDNADVPMVMCLVGQTLYYSKGAALYFSTDAPYFASPTTVTTTNTQNITAIVTDGYRVWFACGSDGVFETDSQSTSVTQAATPPALDNVQGLLAYVAGAGTVNATNLPNGSTTWYVTKVDAFGNETAATSVTATVASTPMNINWQPDTLATNFNVYRGTGTLVYTGDVPSFVDDGSVAGVAQTRPTSNGTGATAYPATFLLYAKGHLLGSTGRDLNEILADGSISFIYQHENPNFVWTCGCECPSAILVGGYAQGFSSGGGSFIGAIQPDSATNGATLAPPIWATTLTTGEQINDIIYDAGAICMATNIGIRTGTKPDSNGVFDVNPVITLNGGFALNVIGCQCLASWGQYVYFGWSNWSSADPWRVGLDGSPVQYSGIGRADLSQYTTPGVPAYATDIMVSGGDIDTTAVAVCNGVPVFITGQLSEGDNYALYTDSGEPVDSGYLEPGWIRYGTLEPKILVEVDFQHDPLPDGASVGYQIVLEDQETVFDVITNDVAGSTTLDEPIPFGLQTGDRFMPIITLNASSPDGLGDTFTPVFRSHITKAMVVTKRQDEVLLALVWADKVRTLGPDARTLPMTVLNEYAYLKNLEGTGVPVTLTMGNLVKEAYIDQVMMEPLNEMAPDRSFFMGTLTVKLITLS